MSERRALALVLGVATVALAAVVLWGILELYHGLGEALGP